MADDLREGAFLVTVPFVERRGKLKRVNLSLDVGTLRMIDAAAKSMKMTLSGLVAMAAEMIVGCTARETALHIRVVPAVGTSR